MELVVEFLLFFAELLFWMFVFNLVLKVIFGRQLKELEDARAEHTEIVEKLMDMLHSVKQEQHGDVLYWFDADTDQFLAQGKSDSEIKEHLKERFKGHVFIFNDKALAGPNLEPVPISELMLKNKNTIGVKTVN